LQTPEAIAWRDFVSRRTASLATVALLLCGCGATHGDAGEFRRAMTRQGKIERLDVNRSVRDIVATFRERASACLQTATRTYSSHHGPLGTVTEWNYTPTVVEADNRVELHLQARQTVAIEIAPVSPKGFFVFLVQATPIDARRSRLEIWNMDWGKALPAAVKGWANGTFSGCPDLT
jgi:hypothetical protein